MKRTNCLNFLAKKKGRKKWTASRFWAFVNSFQNKLPTRATRMANFSPFRRLLLFLWGGGHRHQVLLVLLSPFFQLVSSTGMTGIYLPGAIAYISMYVLGSNFVDSLHTYLQRATFWKIINSIKANKKIWAACSKIKLCINVDKKSCWASL
jgi:hypothetical protein